MEVSERSRSDADGARDEVERLAEEFCERRRRGERPTIDEYVAAHPHLATSIRGFFQTLLIVEDLGSGWSDVATGAPPAPQDRPHEPGLQQVGEYRVLREIGRGGMGVVYEAEQESLGRRVALKVLPFHSLLDPKRLERFQQEARAAARLSHPNIVPVYGVGEHLGIHYYVMQFIPGQGLNRVIEELRRLRDATASGGDDSEQSSQSAASSSSTLPLGLESRGGRGGRDRYFHNIARLARDAALALDYAHREGVLHRDVKPSNLLLDPGGRVWLTDFGLAKADDCDELTRSGDFVGTLLYMAPERLKGWSDPCSDVYALGMTLYELLTLRPAFTERNRAELLRRVAGEEPPAPRRVDRSIPFDLETITLTAIAKEPLERYGSARAMAEDLDRFLLGRPIEARRSRTLARLGRWCARNPLLTALSAAVLILLLTVAVISSISALRLEDEYVVGQEKLRLAYLAEAGAIRVSARPERRLEALEALREAAAIRPDPDLVDEAVACLSMTGLHSRGSWSKGKDEWVAVSADGSLAALASPGGEISIRSTSGHELFRLPAPGFRAAFCIGEFSPDGRHLAARYEQGKRCEWRVWDLGRRVACVDVKDGFPDHGVAFARDGNWVALAVTGRALRFYDLATGAALRELGGDLAVLRAAIHPGGRLLAMSSERTHRVHILDLESGHAFRPLAGHGDRRFVGVAWHPDGTTLAAACDDHKIYVWNAATGDISRSLQGHWAEARGVCFNPTGSLLASFGWDPAARFWEPGSDSSLFTIHHKYGGFSGDRGCWTATEEAVEFWELTMSPAAFTLFGHSQSYGGAVAKHPHTVSLAAGGRLAASAGDDGVRLWDLAARREVALLDVGRVKSVLIDGAGTTLYASGAGGISRWPLRPAGDGRTRMTVGPPTRLSDLDRCGTVDLSRDDRKLAVAHDKTHAHVLDTGAPEHEIILYGPTASELSLALSPDGLWAATGERWRPYGEDVWIWDLREVRAGAELKEPTRKLRAPNAQLCFHPAGTHVATCTPIDCTLWRLTDGKPEWRVEREKGLAHPGPVVFDRDGKVVAFPHGYSRIRLIDAESGRKLVDLAGPEAFRVSSLSLEGSTLAAATIGRRIHVWDLRGLAGQLEGLGLTWDAPVAGKPLEPLPPLHVAVVEKSIDLLLDESVDLHANELFRPVHETGFLTELVSCRQIDQALAVPRFLILDGESWQYFRGRAEPSPGMEWTDADHDDRTWPQGRTPLSGWPVPEREEGTHLSDQLGSYTTLYARRVFDVADAAVISRLVLACEVEDGVVAYLNGVEIGRVLAGRTGERLGFQALATRTELGRRVEVFEIPPSLLQSRRNVLALQALSYGLDSCVHVRPVLAAVLAPSLERDRRRTEGLTPGPDGEPDPALLAYREGRVLQRAGLLREALGQFERASSLDNRAAEPLLRRLACHRALGELARAEALARQAIEAGDIREDDRLWRAWQHVALAGQQVPAAQVVPSLPRDPRAARGGAAGDHEWILTTLAEAGVVRINSGGGDFEATDGTRWSRDRFFLAGTVDLKSKPAEGARASREDPREPTPTQESERWFSGDGSFRRGYSIPLPSGSYRVHLHLMVRTLDNRSERVFDVVVEGRTVPDDGGALERGLAKLRGLLATPTVRSLDVSVTDGALDIDFLAHRNNPGLCAIEIEALPETPVRSSQ